MSYDDPRKPDTSDHSALIEKFNAWDSAIASHWAEWRDEARECFAMVAGHQLDDDTKKAAEDANVFYAVINEIDGVVSAICGSEINGRQEVKFYPREMSERQPVIDPQTGQPQVNPQTGEPVMGPPSDAKVNEILTGAAEWVRQECDAAEEESQAFRDAIICGVGVTETRMSYDEDPEGMPVVERIDPLEIAIDPSSKRPNAVDARYLRRRKRFPKSEAAERFGLDINALPTAHNNDRSGPHDNDPGSAYKGKANADAPLGKDEIEVDQYQWFEMVDRYAVLNPQSGQIEYLDEEKFQRLTATGVQFQHNKTRRRRYRMAFRIASQMLEVKDLPDEDFTWKLVTGKHDRNKGCWYGVVRAMIDPQRLKNKMISQTQRIIDHNAKGGLLAELDAFEDRQQAEEEWAGSDTIVWTKSGAVAKGAVIPKPIAPFPAAIDRMFQAVGDAIYQVSGVNKEMLGLQQGTDQAGILDHQRKQAAYAVLAGFFDSLRRYRRMHARLLLKMITKYMARDENPRLIRVVGRQGNIQYLPLIKQPDTLKYDVIVDEAPAGPNQKDKTFMFLSSPFGAQALKGLPPQIQMKFLEYSPLPVSLVTEIQQMMQQMPPQEDPALVKAKTDAQVQQMKMQADQQQAAAQLQLEQQRSAAELQQKREAAELDAIIMSEKSQREAQLAREKAEAEMSLAVWKAQQEFSLARQRAQWERELAQEKADSQHEIGMKKASMNGSGISSNRPGGSLSE